MNRPHFHFTPQKGWMNDPNGMVYMDGEYHLFYQHYPDDIVWGPMHWGHAVSKDLLHWEHKKIALYPDELGYIFSGSCIYDKENCSGLGAKETPPLLAFFTHHDPKSGRQQQSIAYSLDKEHFIKYEGNPVIANIEKKDFRDPKVFENPVKGGFTMAVAAGEVIEFYHSTDLLNWKWTGSFQPGADGNGYSGICECPDCFPMETEEGTKWVLIISMCLMEEAVAKNVAEGGCANAHVMQYYVGEFNGDTFMDTTCAGEPLLFEFGTDNYAAVTFAQCSESIMLGWGENWNYVKETPAGGCAHIDINAAPEYKYRGKMTIARKLALVKTRFGYRMQSKPIGIEKTSHTQMEYGKECELVFGNNPDESLVIHIMQDQIIVDRSLCGVEKTAKKKHYDILRSPRFYPEGSNIEIIYDEGYYEIFAEDGLASFSVMTYDSPM